MMAEEFGVWRVKEGVWSVEGEGWRVEGEGWRVEGGGWRGWVIGYKVGGGKRRVKWRDPNRQLSKSI